MKRYLAIFGFVFIGVIAGLIVRGIPIVLQVNAGGGIQADRNGDVNGDARLDMSDAIYLLLHIFRDGPQPVAFAQGLPDNVEQLLEEIANPCEERPGRFIVNGDGTVTDSCTGLMWRQNIVGAFSWEGAVDYCENLVFADHDDWRLPKPSEYKSILNRDFQGGLAPVFDNAPSQYWTAQETLGAGAWYLRSGHPNATVGNQRDGITVRYYFEKDPKTAAHAFYAVRDIAPGE